MTWRTSAITLPGWLEDSDLPENLDHLAGFQHFARDASIDVEVGGSVELQRVGASGAWETFDTTTEAADFVMVANRDAIRFVPVGGCSYRIRWKQ